MLNKGHGLHLRLHEKIKRDSDSIGRQEAKEDYLK